MMDIKSPVGEGRNTYTYAADGRKLKVIQQWNSNYSTSPVIGSAITVSSLNQTKTTEYVGNMIYENGALKRILIDGGYIEGGVYYYYLRDHLGNNRVVANASGTVIQRNHYYPFGMAFAETSSTEQGLQPYKYNDKELDRMHGLNLYDYEARYMEPALGRFTTMDPLAEKYYSMSPYGYCGGNPVNAIDPTGMATYLLYDDGRMILAKADITEEDKKKKDIIYAAKTDNNKMTTVDWNKSVNVSDKSFLPQLTGLDRTSAAAETSKSSDAFGVFKFAADNSNPEWSLKGYGTEGGGTGFLLSTSYNDERVNSGNGSYDPSNLQFDLHSHPAGSDNLGPSGSLTRAPGSNSYFPGNLGGDLYQMINNFNRNPNTKHYIYHTGSKNLIYYDHLTSVNKSTQNERGRNMGVVNSASQVRKRIIGR